MTNSVLVRAAPLLALVLVIAGCGGGSEKAPDPAAYSIETFNGWPQITKEERVGGYIENAWRDPVSPIIAVDSRAADETASPMANAELAQVLTNKLPGFKERGLKKIRLGGRPTVSWAFDIADESRVYYFFEECDISFVVRGEVIPVAFEALSESFRDMASTIKVKDCDE